MKSGLTPSAEDYFDATFAYPDEAAMLTAHLAAGPAVLAPRTSGEAAVAAALRDALASFRTASGSYRIESEWRYVTAEA